MADQLDALQEAMAQRALAYATPQTLPQVQRSAYLADALSQLRQQGGQNLRTPGALASTLMAEALDRFGLERAQKRLAQGTLDNENAHALALAGAAHVDPGSLGLGGGGAGPADTMAAAGMAAPPAGGAAAPGAGAGATAAPAPSAPIMPPPPQAQPPQAAPPQSAQPQGFHVGPQDEDAAIRMAWGEARGEGRIGQQAAVATAMHRAEMSGQPLASVIAAPGQFAGFSPRAMALDPNSPEYQRIRANIEPVLQGQTDPVPGADHFWAPQGMPNGATPGWARGQTPVAIGNQRFLHTGSWPGFNPAAGGGQPPGPFAMPPGAAPPPQAGMGAPMPPPQPPPGGPPPASGQSFGPNPVSPPLGAANSPAPPPAGGPGAGASSPQGGLAATPQELAIVQQYLHSPFFDLRQKGQQMLMEIAQRQATPESAPGPEYHWDAAAGRWAPKPGAGYTDTAGGPGGFVQRDGLGRASTVSNPNQSAPPPGFSLSYGPNGQTVMTPNGQVPPGAGAPGPAAGPQGAQPVPGGPQGSFRIPGASGFYMMNPATQRPEKVADDQFDPAKMRQDLLTSDTWKDYQSANAAWKAMTANATMANGISGYAIRDTFARVVNPGAVARVGTIQAIMDSPGLPDQIKQMLLHLGNGSTPPQVVQQLLDAAQPFAMAHYQAMQQLNAGNADLASRHPNLDVRDVTQPLDAAPTRFVLPQFRPHPAPAAPPGGGNPAPDNDAAAELIRRGYHWNGTTFVK